MTTAKAMFFDIFMSHGFPKRLLTDKGSNFVSAMMMELYKLFDIHKLTTSPYRPQCDGQNENSHRFIFKIVKILSEHNPKEWTNCCRVAAFAWNLSTMPELSYLSPFEIIYGEQPRLPHDLTMLRMPTAQEERMEPADYENYAQMLSDRFEIWLSVYKEARFKAAHDRTVQHNHRIKDAGKVEWLSPGKLVIVYRPTATCDGDKWSQKLLFQFAGPYRIEKVARNAVHMKNLDGSPASTHNIGNVYPYSVLQDDCLEQFDRRLLTQEDKGDSYGEIEGHMVIIDLSDAHGQDFRIGKVTRKIDRKTFEVHYYETNSRARSMNQWAYFPNYYVLQDSGESKEVNTLKPASDSVPNTNVFTVDELLFKPFHLTKKHHVPKEIIEKLQLAGFVCLIVDFTLPWDFHYDAVYAGKRKLPDDEVTSPSRLGRRARRV